jgi:glycosyltransferase involved in cell wall biosynthesis
MKVFVVDQSFFGLLYDVQFSAALAAAGADTTLVGRPLRPYEEVTSGGFRMLPLFYGFAERLPGRLKPLAKATKGLEHARGMRALIDLVERERPDVVHFQWIVLPVLDRVFLPRLARLAPLVLTVHNSVPFHGTSSSALMLKGQDEALRRFDHFIPHTDNIKAYLLRQGIPEARIDLRPHPAVRLPRVPEAAARHAAKGPGDPVEILLFGSIKPYKGVDVLVRAGLALAGRRRDFRITVAGKPFYDLGPLRAEIEAAGAGDLIRLDARHQSEQGLGTRLEEADIVVFPYREIDASGAFACASQFGKPIVATELGVFADPPVRDHLRLLPPEDPGALAAVLEDLIANPAARADLAARSRALQDIMYTWERFARDCLDLYARLARAREGRPVAAAA